MTARIEEIRLQNFRAFENARLTLSDLTFVAGRNGAGKSSVLDAVEFVREALTDNLPNALARRDGLLRVRRLGARSEEPLGVAVLLHLPVGTRRVRVLYGFRIRSVDHRIEIEEALRLPDLDPILDGTEEQRGRRREGFVKGPEGFHTDARISPAAPADRLLLPAIAGASELWKMTWDVLSRMRGYEISPHAMAEPALIRPGTALDRIGANVGDVLDDLGARPEDKAWVNRHLGGVTEGMRGVDARVEIGHRVLQFMQRVDSEGEQRLAANQVSQGTLRALGMLLALRQSPAPSLVMIDEIEDSIHPLAVDVLLEAIEQTCERFPVVVTTHSPEVLGRKAATGDRIRVAAWDEGVSRLHRLGAGTLAQLDDVTTVGWLLSTNGLGMAQPAETWTGDLLEWV